VPTEGLERPAFGTPEGACVLEPAPISLRDAGGSCARGRGRDLAIVLAAIAAIWLIAASRWIVTDTVVPWDAKNQFYAFFRFLAATIHAGHAPFWNPYHYGGHPSVADPQSLVFSPPFVLWAWFDPAPSIRAFDLIVYAHLAVGGLAVGALGWRAGWPMPASILAAVIFMFGGPASGRLQHSGIITSYGLFPLALLLMQVALRRRSVLVASGFGMVAAVLALGRNHEALLLSFVLGAVLAVDIAAADDRRRYLRERTAVLATMATVSAALLAVPLLLTVQFAGLSNRPEVPLEKALEASLYPANLASLAVANVMGSLESTQNYWGPNYDTLPAVGATDRSFNYLFVGAASTLVVLWFGLAGGGMLRRANRVMATVLLVALLYALGRYTPLYALAFQYVPGISLFRRPIDGAFVLVAAFALVAGQLLADYVREGIPRVVPWRLAAVGAGALAIVAWAVLFSEISRRGWSSLWEALKVAPLVLLLIVVLARARTAEMRALAAACVALAATAELIWCNAASSVNAEGPAYYSVLQNPVGADARALDVLEQELESRHKQGERPRVEIVGVSGSWQNLAMARGLEATNGYNPLRIGAYDRLVSPGETTHIVDQRLFPASFDGYDCALARELGLEYIVLGRPIEEVPHLRRRPVSDVLLAGPRVWIYRLRGAQPRVTFIRRVMVADADAQVRAGQFPVNPAGETAQIDDDTAPLRQYRPMSSRRDRSWADILSWSPDRLEIEVESDQPGIVMAHDIYYPGWVAEIDGQPARVLRANVLFRGVEVSEGRHIVVFRFAPFALANLRNAFMGLFAGPR
jgi:hypothetical protein